MLKNSTFGVFINSEWSAFRNSGPGHVRNSELGTTFGGHSNPNWGHSDLGVQSGRKNQPACLSVCLSVCMYVTLVHSTQTLVIFGNISTAFGTLPSFDTHINFMEIIKYKRGSQI